MSKPVSKRTKAHGGVHNPKHDSRALFEAAAQGDVARVKALIAKDPRLVNQQVWYQLPIHLAVYAGHADVVKLLLHEGADPGQSVYTYNSWDKLLRCAYERGYRQVESLLKRAMKKRFNYAPEFDVLKEAIIARDSRQIGSVLRRSPELVSASDALGNNALHWSVMTRQLDMIDRFVELGTPIDALRADGQTPVLLAVNGATDYWYRATRGRSHPSLRDTSVIVGFLLAKGANYTISVAAAVGDQERVELLLKKDPELAKRLDSARLSPLSYAAHEGHLHIVRLLLEHGADPNIAEAAAPNGLALFNACAGNHLQVAQLLLEHGANPNAGADSSGCCLTIGEVNHGNRAKRLQQLLRSHGAYIPSYEMSVQEMKEAISEGHEVVRDEEFLGRAMQARDAELLDRYLDSDPTILMRMDYWGSLIYPRSPAVVKKLLERGLDPNHPHWLGRTFLHACAEKGDRSVAEVFLEAGADINARDVEFQGTPLAAAVRACCETTDPKRGQQLRKMVEFLLKRGAATNLPDDQTWATPLAWAARHGNDDLVALLKVHGAK